MSIAWKPVIHFLLLSAMQLTHITQNNIEINNDVCHTSISNKGGIVKIDELFKAASSPKSREELGIVVCDGSGSMTELDALGEQKNKAVERAIRELVNRLSRSSRKDEVSLAMYTFDDRVELKLAPTPVTQIDPNANFDPLVGHGNATAIGDGLFEALRLAEEYLNNAQAGLPRDVVVMLLSDGQNNTGSNDPRTIARQIKNNNQIVLVTAAFGTDADRGLLQDVCSDPNKYYAEPKTGDELRDYFLASLESIERV